jgi:hypothetical protein
MDDKKRYQWVDAGYPQLAQGDEYSPIEAVQALYVGIVGSNRHLSFGAERGLASRVENTQILIGSPTETVTVALGEDRVKVGSRLFNDQRTVSLFGTLGRVLTDIGAHCEHQGIRGMRYANRAYRDVMQIEFSYGPLVVRLEGLSNGPTNPERYYGLDVVWAVDSSLWRDEPP